MNASVRIISMVIAGLSAATAPAGAEVNLVKPVVPAPAIDPIKGEKGAPACGQGLVIQKKGQCCPPGTNNDLWPLVCVPDGILDNQIFNGPEGTRYCADAAMFIVSDRNRNWVSCASSDSTPLYAAARNSAGGDFCRGHGYGHLIRIKPWGTVGCIKIGDSQGDGCIEAGTCSYPEAK